MFLVYLIWFAVILAVFGTVTLSIFTQMMEWDVDRFLNWLRSARDGWIQKWAHGWRVGRNKEGEITAGL